MKRWSVVLVVVAMLGGAPAAAAPTFVPPVAGPIERFFEAPTDPYGPGHRGIDYRVPQGTVVRAAGAGTVTFAGEVAGALFVAIDHGDGLETTYSRLAEIFVEDGLPVAQGAGIGTSGEAHPGHPGLHLGVKRDGGYVDPMSLLASQDVSDAIRLMPVGYDKPVVMGRAIDVREPAGRTPDGCKPAGRLPVAPVAPNDNLVVAIAGIGSSSDRADMFEHGPDLLGYPPQRIFRFSYRGIEGPDLHEPYGSRDSWVDIYTAARRLNDLLVALHRRYPDRNVDLIAHSQGGIVARTFLELRSMDPEALPAIEHLVTFASPHHGAPGVALLESVNRASGGLLARLAESGAPWPSPGAIAVGQLAPHSSLMDALAAGAPPFGTRYLSLAIPNDVVVPADRALLEGGRTVGPEGLNGHSAIVASWSARALAYDFLRDAARPCPGGWDRWGPWIGRVVSLGEWLGGAAVAAATPW